MAYGFGQVPRRNVVNALRNRTAIGQSGDEIPYPLPPDEEPGIDPWYDEVQSPDQAVMNGGSGFNQLAGGAGDDVPDNDELFEKLGITQPGDEAAAPPTGKPAPAPQTTTTETGGDEPVAPPKPVEEAAAPPADKPVPEVEPPTITPLGEAMGPSQAEGALLMKWLSDNHIIPDRELALAKLGLDMPAETAARIQVGKSFLDQYPDLRFMIERGDVTGLGDYVAGKVNPQSQSASVQRKLNSGLRAMRYMLSGATLGEHEETGYEADYSPAFLDSNISLLDKTDQLAREMQYAMRGLAMGRGGMDLINDLNAGKANEFNPDNEFMTSRAAASDPEDLSTLSDEDLLKQLMGGTK